MQAVQPGPRPKIKIYLKEAADTGEAQGGGSGAGRVGGGTVKTLVAAIDEGG